MSTARLQRSLRATFIGMAVNAVLALAKLVAGIVGHSHALVADAVESLSDLFSSIIVWRALVVSEAPADKDHPYGHGKAEPLAAACVSVILLLAALGIMVQAIREIIHPHQSPAPFTLVVLIGVIVIKEGLFRFVAKEADIVESIAVRSDAWHHRSDAITSFAAGVGIIVALIGGKGWEASDDIAALLAAFIIAWNGWRMLRPALDELMDASPDVLFLERIANVAATVEGVILVEKCLVRKMGFHFFVDMHVEVAPTMTVSQAHDIAHAVKDRIRESLPSVKDVLIHIEPAGRDKSKKSGG